jgi:hypothetical protein
MTTTCTSFSVFNNEEIGYKTRSECFEEWHSSHFNLFITTLVEWIIYNFIQKYILDGMQSRQTLEFIDNWFNINWNVIFMSALQFYSFECFSSKERLHRNQIPSDLPMLLLLLLLLLHLPLVLLLDSINQHQWIYLDRLSCWVYK